ncbi:hypothetical protein SAY87_003758 [Trapa incisa]|uniref:SET domain-containing protein n=1 Tax=Trapa incisa TaxID=236973 RepID=A0AAN7QI39_9MYRT|nr:hypothetical protein SAY87_003758 [Trapa incisa]
MERLKSLVPDELKQRIATSMSNDLLSTSSSVISFFLHLEQFHLITEDLADPKMALCSKNKDAAMEFKQNGNRFFSNGNHSLALSYYSKALRVAPLEKKDDEKNKDLGSVLFVNRAAALYRVGLPMECIRDCDRALRRTPSYAKAWFWRGKANAALKDYGNACSDLKIAKLMEATSLGKKQVECELSIVLQKISEVPSLPLHNNDERLRKLDEKCEVELECVVTREKGRGMVSKGEVPPSTLVHMEEPYVAIISKNSRDSHCHYCFDELPADYVPCTSCSIPLYCSETCRGKAGGGMPRNREAEIASHESIPRELKKHFEDITLKGIIPENLNMFHEHDHECSGANWAAVLPSELVLAGRVIVKALGKRGDFLDTAESVEPLDLCHSYSELAPNVKLESHIYSIVLLRCLQSSCSFEIPINAVSVSRTIILLSQIRVNAMAVVRIKSSGEHLSFCGFDASSIEQVKVGQAIYARGSLFNHSCQPNIHIYFLSRNLYIRTTEQVAEGHPLELSYGPQIGQWTCKDRQKFLKEEYSFQCQCSGCSTVLLSDLALNSVHCVSRDCNGIVIETAQVSCERNKIKHHWGISSPESLEPYLQIENLNNLDREPSRVLPLGGGYCLKCRSFCDLHSSQAAIDEAWINFERLKDEATTIEPGESLIFNASKSFNFLKLKLHPFNKRIAEAEDILAKAFCRVGDYQSAQNHCCSSIMILEKLYSPKHIVIAYELLKLLSIKMASGNYTSSETADRLNNILRWYYGSHVDAVFPSYMGSLVKGTNGCS